MKPLFVLVSFSLYFLFGRWTKGLNVCREEEDIWMMMMMMKSTVFALPME